MKNFLRAVLILALLAPPLPSPVYAAGAGCTAATLVPFNYEELAVSTVAVGFTTSKIQTTTGSAIYAFIYVGSNAIRWRDDGTNPTGASGQPAAAGERIEVCGLRAVQAVKFIRQSADATLFISYYRGE